MGWEVSSTKGMTRSGIGEWGTSEVVAGVEDVVWVDVEDVVVDEGVVGVAGSGLEVDLAVELLLDDDLVEEVGGEFVLLELEDGAGEDHEEAAGCGFGLEDELVLLDELELGVVLDELEHLGIGGATGTSESARPW